MKLIIGQSLCLTNLRLLGGENGGRNHACNSEFGGEGGGKREGININIYDNVREREIVLHNQREILKNYLICFVRM